MLNETKWNAVPSQPFTVSGTTLGILEIANAALFRVGMIVQMSSSVVLALNYKINRIDDTEITVGREGFGINDVVDISTLLTTDTAVISALEQNRIPISQNDVLRYVFDEAPTIALRSSLVDADGNRYDANNMLPVDIGAASISTTVDLTHLENFPNPGDVADSVQVGDGTTVMKVDVQNMSISANRYEKLLPLVSNANWLKQVNFESIVPIFAGDVATLEYMQAGNIVARLIATFVTDSNWTLVFESYINGDSGIPLNDDDGSLLFLS